MRPRNRWRVSAKASGNAKSVLRSAVSAASFKLKSSGVTHSAANARSHQRNEKPRGGKNERFVALNETAAVIRIGPSEKT